MIKAGALLNKSKMIFTHKLSPLTHSSSSAGSECDLGLQMCLPAHFSSQHLLGGNADTFFTLKNKKGEKNQTPPPHASSCTGVPLNKETISNNLHLLLDSNTNCVSFRILSQ